MILFRGSGAAACRYLESDRSRADDYYLEDGATLAAFTVTDGTGEVRMSAQLDAQAYAGWVDWVDPLTGASMGKPRLPGEEGASKHGSPRFAEMIVNTPKSLSIAAALHPEVSAALDASPVRCRRRDPAVPGVALGHPSRAAGPAGGGARRAAADRRCGPQDQPGR